MKNEQIAEKLRLFAQLLELRVENPFKIKAYRNAADVIENLTEEVSILLEKNQFHGIKGIGATIRDSVIDLLYSGSFPALNEMLAVTPSGVIELLKIKGLGPKKVSQLWQTLNITSPGELLHACQENRLARAKGFGEKSQAQIQKAVEFYVENQNKLHYFKACEVVEQLIKTLQTEWKFVIPTGAFRRKLPVIESIEFVVCSPTVQPSSTKFIREEYQYQLHEYASSLSSLECPIILYKTEPERLISVLAETTAWGKHLERIYPYLHQTYQTEQELYETAGLQWIEPEFRENQGEIELAETRNLPQLITGSQIRGLVHAHSTDSDGAHSIAEMASAAQQLGLEYLVITDHSQSAFYANGLTIGRMEVQHLEIERLNQVMKNFKIFKGIESDILT
ncbi:MAG: helix-hairpin-helix domain-containing protein, partial [Bacteroidia bacterium]|nr:helix-hairpin-helix domain-containing protein [Bacteroidia bacterium]